MDVTFNPTPIFFVIIGALIGLFAGWVIGFFDSNNRTAQKIKVAEAKAEEKMMEAEEKLKQAEKLGQTGTSSSDVIVRDDPGLLRIKNNNGDMLVEMDGTLLTKPLSADRRKRLLDLINVFRPWLETPQAPSAPLASAPVQSAPRTPPPPAPKPSVAPAVKPVPMAFGVPPKKQADPETEFKLLSMVQQIDSVLQTKIAGTSFEKDGLHLKDSISGGLEVHMGSDTFESIDDVPDEKAKALIRTAIAEWEQKYVPGA